MLSVVSPKSSYAIGVLSICMGGQGDLATGHHISAIARRAFPKHEVIFCQMQDPLFDLLDRVLPLPNTSSPKSSWETRPIQDLYESVRKGVLKIIIINSWVGDKMIPRALLPSHIPIIRLGEYGVSCLPPAISLGCFSLKVSFKVLFYDNLYRERFEFRMRTQIPLPPYFSQKIVEYVGPDFETDSQSTLTTPSLESLQYLAKIPEDLQRAILPPGATFTNQIQQFNATGALYSGYAHALPPICHFIEGICATSHAKMIVIIVLKNLKEIPHWQTFISREGFPKKLNVQALKSSGFGRIQIHGVQDTGLAAIKKIKLRGEGERRLKIIFKPLSQSETDALSCASQDATLCTGDSSTLKALALGKHFGMENSPHKMVFLKSLATTSLFFKKVLLELFEITTSDNQDKKQSENSFVARMEVMGANRMIPFFEAMKKPLFGLEWRKFIYQLYKSHNFNPTLVNQIETTIDRRREINN